MKWPKIRIRLSLILLIALAITSKEFINLILILFVILIHELGHIIMIKFKKCSIEKITFSALGASLETNCLDSQLVNFGRHPCKHCIISNFV